MEPMVPFYNALITTEQHFQCKRLSTGSRDGTQSLSGSQEHKAGCSVCGPGVPWGWRHSVYGSKVQSSYSYGCHGVQELGTWCLQVQGHRGSWGWACGTQMCWETEWLYVQCILVMKGLRRVEGLGTKVPRGWEHGMSGSQGGWGHDVFGCQGILKPGHGLYLFGYTGSGYTLQMGAQLRT